VARPPAHARAALLAVGPATLLAVAAVLLAALALALAAAPARGARPQPLPAPAAPPSYLVTPTDQLGWPGQQEGTEVTPEGDLYTGWAELAFEIGDGSTFDPTTHSLADGRYPVVHLFRVLNDVLYELDALQTSVLGRPVTFARVSVTNLGTTATRARVAAGVRYDGGEFGARRNICCLQIYRFPRPRTPDRDGYYWQPGAPFSAASVYALQGAALLRDGQAVAFFPQGGPRLRFRQALASTPPPADTRAEFGRATYDIALRPHERRELAFTLPVIPLAPTDSAYATVQSARFAEFRAVTVRFWRGLLGGAMRVALPERKVVDTFYASIMQDALARYRLDDGLWVQAVNLMRYHAFWLRDGAFINELYLLVGLDRLARENLDFFGTWQRPDGLFIARPEEYDGFGEALWAYAEYVRHTGDARFARAALPAVARAMDWLAAERARDPLGLMPPVQHPSDNELVTGHIAGDNFLAVAGVAGAVDIARAAGDPADAARWQAVYNDFATKVRANAFHAQQAHGGAIPPALDRGGGQDWGNLWAAYPWRVLSPTSHVVRATLRRVRNKFAEGIATYADRQLLHAYLGFRVFETELEAGDQRDAVAGLYAELAHTTGSNAGWEASTAPYGDRVVDDTTVPHGWFAAEYATLLRNMLVREDGATVYLMSAVSPAWLRPGQRIAVAGAPTTRGRVSFALTGRPGGAVLSWTTAVRGGTRLVWPVPYAARDVRAPGLDRGAGVIVLHGRAGRLAIKWRLVGTDPTFDAAFRRLMTAYFYSPTGAARVARAHGALPAVPSKP
jgi:hypothetical protein